MLINFLKILLLLPLFCLPGFLHADIIDEEGDKTPRPSISPKKDELLDHTEPPESSVKPSSTPSPSSSAGKKTPAKKQTAASVVRFSSKGLRGSRKEGTVFLEEDVVVTQEDMRMESNEAKVLFDEKSNLVREIQAFGNVRFFKIDPETQQKIRAEAKEAYFYNQEQKVMLKGEPKLWRGDDKMVGRTINYDLKTGWIKADKVEGVVQPATVKQKGKK